MRISDWSSDVCSSDLLVMSDVAQRRDIADPRTVRDFANLVQSPERLKMLYVHTVVDIKAVGPGVWNGWKEIGRASCREGVCQSVLISVVAVLLKNKT